MITNYYALCSAASGFFFFFLLSSSVPGESIDLPVAHALWPAILQFNVNDANMRYTIIINIYRQIYRR